MNRFHQAYLGHRCILMGCCFPLWDTILEREILRFYFLPRLGMFIFVKEIERGKQRCPCPYLKFYLHFFRSSLLPRRKCVYPLLKKLVIKVLRFFPRNSVWCPLNLAANLARQATPALKIQDILRV